MVDALGFAQQSGASLAAGLVLLLHSDSSHREW
jgi:hypothetical protein